MESIDESLNVIQRENFGLLNHFGAALIASSLLFALTVMSLRVAFRRDGASTSTTVRERLAVAFESLVYVGATAFFAAWGLGSFLHVFGVDSTSPGWSLFVKINVLICGPSLTVAVIRCVWIVVTARPTGTTAKSTQEQRQGRELRCAGSTERDGA